MNIFQKIRFRETHQSTKHGVAVGIMVLLALLAAPQISLGDNQVQPGQEVGLEVSQQGMQQAQIAEEGQDGLEPDIIINIPVDAQNLYANVMSLRVVCWVGEKNPDFGGGDLSQFFLWRLTDIEVRNVVNGAVNSTLTFGFTVPDDKIYMDIDWYLCETGLKGDQSGNWYKPVNYVIGTDDPPWVKIHPGTMLPGHYLGSTMGQFDW